MGEQPKLGIVKLSRRTFLYILTVVCALATVGIWLRLRSTDPSVSAKKGLEALIAGDSRTIFWMRSHDEASATGLTEESFAKVWNSIIWPVLSKVKIVGDVVSTKQNDPPTQGIADVRIVLPDGTPSQLILSVWVTEDRPRHLALWDTLSQVWTLQDQIDNPSVVDSPGRKATAKLAGLSRHRSELEALGIRGMLSPNGDFFDWDRLQKRWEWELAMSTLQNRPEAGKSR